MTVKKAALYSIFLSLALRACFIYLYGSSLTSDETDYYRLAINILSGNGFTAANGSLTAYRPPAYPLFVAGILSLFHSPYAVEIIQALSEIGSGLLLYRMGKHLFSESAGLRAMILWNLFPASIIASSQFMSESVFTFLLLLFLSFEMLQRRNSIPKQLASGIIAGILILLKPQMLFVLVGIGIYSLFKSRSAAALRTALVMTAGIVLVVSPWVIRNKIVFNEFLLTTNGGMNFWIGSNDGANGSYTIPASDPLTEITSEPEQNAAGYRLGFSFIQQHPFRFIELAVLKAGYLFSSQNYAAEPFRENTERGISYRERTRMIPVIDLILLNIPYLGILFFGTAGFFLLLKKYRPSAPLHSYLLLWIVVHILYFGAARFLYPVLPLFCLLAGGLPAARETITTLKRNERYAVFFIAAGTMLPTLAEIILSYALK